MLQVLATFGLVAFHWKGPFLHPYSFTITPYKDPTVRKSNAFAMEKAFRHEYCREDTVLSQEKLSWQQTHSLAGSYYHAPADSDDGAETFQLDAAMG